MKTKKTKTPAQLRTATAALLGDYLKAIEASPVHGEAAEALAFLRCAQADLASVLAGGWIAEAAAATPATPAAPADLTDAQLFAHYRKIAPAEDLAFLVRHGRLSSALEARARAVVKPTAADVGQLRAAWRVEQLAAERAAGVPAVGSLAWHEATRDAADVAA